MISYENAQLYFAAKNHVRASVWSSFNVNDRQASIVQARRILAAALGRAMRDNEPAYVEGDVRREEYAVYEQALFMLEQKPTVAQSGSSPIPVAIGYYIPRQAQPEKLQPVAGRFAPEALRWLNWNGVAIIRG